MTARPDHREVQALQELAELCPPPLGADEVTGWPAAVAALDGREPAALRALVDRFGPGAFRAADGADAPFVALVAGDDLTWPSSVDGPLSETYDVSTLVGPGTPDRLRVIAFAFLWAEQPGTELWWWRNADESGVALVSDYEAERLETGPAATVLDLLRGTGHFDGFWANRSRQLTFVPASQRDRLLPSVDAPPDPLPRGVYDGLEVEPARRAAVDAVRRGFRTDAPALGRGIGACLADVDADLGQRLGDRLSRLVGLADRPWEPPYEAVQHGAHLVEQTLFDLEDHTSRHPVLPGLCEGLHALRAAAILLDFFTVEELPAEGLPLDVHYRFNFRDGTDSEAWLEGSPGSAVALAHDRAFIAADLLGLDLADLQR